MDDTTIDIEEVADSGHYLLLEENYEDIAIKEKDYEPDIVDYTETLKEITKKTTIPYLTKYERTRLIGVRAQQLNTGSIPTVIVGDLKSTVKIAEKELRERKIPLFIRRPLPNGEHEDWRIDEFIIE